MLKRKIFAVALPIIAGATIVGSGFAAWVFGTQTTTFKGPTIGIEITEDANLDNISVKTWVTLKDVAGTSSETIEYVPTAHEFVVELDQGSRSEATPNITDADRGIRIKDNKSTKLLEKIQFAVYSEDESLFNLKNAGFEVKLNTTINFNPTLLNYISVKETNTWFEHAGTLTTEGTTGVYKTGEKDVIINNGTGNNHEYYTEVGTNRMTINTGSEVDETTGENKTYHSNKLFTWSKKPANSEELGTMRTELGSIKEGITIAFDLSVVDPTITK